MISGWISKISWPNDSTIGDVRGEVGCHPEEVEGPFGAQVLGDLGRGDVYTGDVLDDGLVLSVKGLSLFRQRSYSTGF